MKKISFPIVGIGASAGGLQAYEQLLRNIPSNTGMAFVIIQHLAPTYKSILTQLLSKATNMPVLEVINGMKVKQNCVYVIPPNVDMAIAHGILSIKKRADVERLHMPIDYFLTSLSAEIGRLVIGVILSGNATDGSKGIKAIKEAGGITFVQAEESAKYNGMPRSAIDTGYADYILSPENIAKQLVKISANPYKDYSERHNIEKTSTSSEANLNKIFTLLCFKTGVDFSEYKRATIIRRLNKRMTIVKVKNMASYVQYLKNNPAEVKALYNDITITVTSFFRDPNTFKALKTKIFPRILKNKTINDSIRIWSAGCSTGEEAYSLAISLAEFFAGQAKAIKVNIFASDISDHAIQKAREGIYSTDIVSDVSKERLRRFFTKTEAGYKVNKFIRDMCVFAKHDITRDPPFSKMDIVVCRNMLIYMGPILQKKVIPAFYYSLNKGGFLMLGMSESIHEFSGLFNAVDKKNKIYIKKHSASRLVFETFHGEPKMKIPADINLKHTTSMPVFDIQKEISNVVLERYAPQWVVLNANLEIIQFHGHTNLFIEHAPGQASLNILKMAREGLQIELGTAISKARKKCKAVRREGIKIKYNHKSAVINFEVIPVKISSSKEYLFVIVFEEAKTEIVSEKKKEFKPGSRTEKAALKGIAEELNVTKKYLQSVIEDNEAITEELKSSNEEIQSSNEELQSTNEELETSKEELQSTNEELTTVNEELQNRNSELGRIISDIDNVLVSANIPIIIVDNNLCIRRFTPMAAKLMNLIDSDMGRLITDIRFNVKISNLKNLIIEVVNSLGVIEQEVRDKDGKWFSMRIRPYRTFDNKIDGAVISLIDIDALKRIETDILAAKEYAENIIDTIHEALVVLDDSLVVISANKAFYDAFNVKKANTEHHMLYKILDGQFDVPELRILLESILPKKKVLDGYEIEVVCPDKAKVILRLNARRLDQRGLSKPMVLLAIEDITEQKKIESIKTKQKNDLQLLFDSVPAMIFYKDKDNHMLKVNRLFAEKMGLKKHEIEDRSCFDIWPDRADCYWKDDLEVLKTGKSKIGIIEPLKTANGEIWIKTDKVPYFDEQGNAAGIIGFSLDITEQRKIDEIKKTKEYAELLYSLTPSAIFTVDKKRKVTSWNKKAEEITGYTASDIIGKECTVFADYPCRDKCGLFAKDILKPITGKECMLETKDGRKRYVLKNVDFLKDKDGNTIGGIESFEDITENKELQAKLLRSEKLAILGKLAGSLGHEIRNPLGIIKNAVYYLNGTSNTFSKDILEYFAIIKRNADIANNIISNTLDFARPKEMQLAGCRINEIIDEVLGDIGNRENIEIEKKYSKDIEIMCDKAKTKSIFHNVILNAIQAIHDKGKIIIYSKKEDDCIKVVVKDNGEGIAEENMQKIFEPLFSTKIRGIGFGMTIVKDAIEKHGWEMNIESKQGQGTSFIVKIPNKKP
jgi:PAS domain S-box-containing protein